MNTFTKKLAAGALGIGILAAGAHAAEAAIRDNAAPGNPMSSVVTAIAQRFGLSQSDVQKVFDEQMALHKTEMESRMKQERAERLATAVSEGKLTQAQADLITAKQDEMRTLHESLKGKTKEEVKAAMESNKASWEQWAKDNGIPAEYLRPAGRKGDGPRLGGQQQ